MFSIHASGRLSDEEREDARREVYERWCDGLRIELQEKNYIPRLIISAVIFLVCYFFLSLAVRDPIPMIDEIAVSLAISLAVFFTLRRSVKKSKLYSALASEAKEEIEETVESEDEDIAAIESYCEELNRRYSPSQIADILSGLSSEELPAFTHSLPQTLTTLLFNWAKREEKAYGAWLGQLKKAKGPDARLAALLKQSAVSDGLDLYLLAFLRQID